jgi:hypothetical protein
VRTSKPPQLSWSARKNSTSRSAPMCQPTSGSRARAVPADCHSQPARSCRFVPWAIGTSTLKKGPWTRATGGAGGSLTGVRSVTQQTSPRQLSRYDQRVHRDPSASAAAEIMACHRAARTSHGGRPASQRRTVTACGSLAVWVTFERWVTQQDAIDDMRREHLRLSETRRTRGRPRSSVLDMTSASA